MLELLCPRCKIIMQEVNRQDVQYEVCGNCRGVWVDRDELEKLLASIKEMETWRKPTGTAPAMSAKGDRPQVEYQREHYNDPDRYSHASSQPQKPGFERLEEIFR